VQTARIAKAGVGAKWLKRSLAVVSVLAIVNAVALALMQFA
jgi:hypothetical protein